MIYRGRVGNQIDQSWLHNVQPQQTVGQVRNDPGEIKRAAEDGLLKQEIVKLSSCQEQFF